MRRDFNTLGDPAIASLRKGIAEMMKRDNGVADDKLDPLGWKYQAFIHGTSAVVAPEPYAWDSCKHGSWYFLSWHRMELYFFERILRALSGDASLTLPYWNFGPPPAGMDPKLWGARLPAAMRVRPTGAQPNSLYWPYRNALLNKAPGPGAADTAAPLKHSDVSTLAAFQAVAFFSNFANNGPLTFGGGATATPEHFSVEGAYGRIESAPHNLMHGAVGLPDADPNAALSMTDPVGAGLDPAFWLVHANIDRAWSCWQKLHPTDAQPNGGTWTTEEFEFWDVDMSSGKPVAKKVTMTGKQVMDTAAILPAAEGLTATPYVYDNACKDFELPPAPSIRTETTELTRAVEDGENARSPRILLSEPAESETLLAAEPVTVSIRIPDADRERIETLLRGDAPAGSILLTVGGVATDKPTAAAYEIYLGLPPGAAPNDQDDHLATHLAFFGIGHHAHAGHHPGMGRDLTYDVTDVVRRLVERGELRDTLPVTFANTAAMEPDRAQPPAASPAARARFTYLKLTVQ